MICLTIVSIWDIGSEKKDNVKFQLSSNVEGQPYAVASSSDLTLCAQYWFISGKEFEPDLLKQKLK